MPTQTIKFQPRTAADSTDQFKQTFERGGTVTRLYVEAVPNEEADVERRWLIEQPNGRFRPITVNVANDYLAGDDTVFDLSVREEFGPDEQLVLEVDNTNPDYSYPNIAFGEESILEQLLTGVR